MTMQVLRTLGSRGVQCAVSRQLCALMGVPDRRSSFGLLNASAPVRVHAKHPEFHRQQRAAGHVPLLLFGQDDHRAAKAQSKFRR